MSVDLTVVTTESPQVGHWELLLADLKERALVEVKVIDWESKWVDWWEISSVVLKVASMGF